MRVGGDRSLEGFGEPVSQSVQRKPLLGCAMRMDDAARMGTVGDDELGMVMVSMTAHNRYGFIQLSLEGYEEGGVCHWHLKQP